MRVRPDLSKFAPERGPVTRNWRQQNLLRGWPLVAIACAGVLIALAAVESWLSLVVTVVVLGLFSAAVLAGVDRDRFQRRRALDQVSKQLLRLEDIASIPLRAIPLDPALTEMVARLLAAVEADCAAVLLGDGSNLTIRAVAGACDPADIGTRIPYGEGLTGLVAKEGRPKSVNRANSETFAIPSFISSMRSAAAAPLKIGETTVGVVAVGHRKDLRYDEGAFRLLEIAADRMTTAIETARLGEREWRASLGHARAKEHMRMLGDTSRVLLRSVDDYESQLTEVINTVVGDFASLAAVFLADGQTDRDLRLAAARLDTDDVPVRFSAAALEPIRGTMAAGRSRLRVMTGPPEPEAHDRDLNRELIDMGITSYVISPIQVRGLAFGALLLGTAREIRGFRPADHAAIDDLAQRIALAIESTLLYREARHNAATTARHLQRLRSLLDTKLAVEADSPRSEILQICARGAGHLYPGSRVVLAVGDEQYDETGRRLIRPFTPDTVAVLGAGEGLMRNIDVPRDLIAPADQELVAERCVVVPLVTVDGERGFVMVETTGRLFSDEDESLLVLLARMMSTSLANEALNEQTRAGAARIQAIFSASPAAIVTLTDALSVHDCNPAARELFGWGPQGCPPHLPADVGSFVSGLATRVKTSHEAQQADLILAGEGGERSLVLMLAPAWTETETEHGFVLVVTDDTERRQLATQFQQAQRLEAIGRLAGGVAHDFNNLLTVIQGYTDGLLRRLGPDDSNRERIAAIARAGARGAELTKQLLTISRQQVVTPIVLRPADVVDEISGMLRRMVGETVKVVREAGDDDARISIDQLQLEQVLLNLAGNARDAMPDGGTMTLSVHRTAVAPPGVISLADFDEPPVGWVELRIADTGIGMDEATLARCLDPLFTTKDPGVGTGLGLSTVYGIVRQNRGDITITSALGQGTTVSIVLPEVLEEVTRVIRTQLPTPSDSAATGTGTILFVEDDHEIRWMVLRMLRERGYHTMTADNGLDAVELMREHAEEINVLLTDVAMPGMSGPEVARAVRAIRPIPVVFVSGYAEKLSKAADRGEYHAEFVAKPFTPEDLVAAITRALLPTAQNAT